MEASFLQKYLKAFSTIEGWFQFDAALMFMGYTQVLTETAAPRDVLEIGVHHGLSTISVAALRGPESNVFAVDLFENLQEKNTSNSGAGHREIFLKNMRSFHPDLQKLKLVNSASGELSPQDLGDQFTFCHIDGGHSRAETLSDLRLCSKITLPGGLIALDDYFNPRFPGVAEGAIEFFLTEKDTLRPVAIGYNKVLLQKAPFTDLNEPFLRLVPQIKHEFVRMWSVPVLLFNEPLRYRVNLYASTPQRLVAVDDVRPRAEFQTETERLSARTNQEVPVKVRVRNTSGEPYPAGFKIFGLSYHLLSSSGETLVHDNDRVWLTESLEPEGEVTLELPVRAPERPGAYKLEIDLVWENVMWFKDSGGRTAIVDLTVS